MERIARSTSWRVVVSILLVASLAAGAAADVTTTWIGGTGDWFDPANWSNGVPRSLDWAKIDQNGVATIASGAAAASMLELAGLTSAEVAQSGGSTKFSHTLRLLAEPGAAATYRLSGGELTAQNLWMNSNLGDNLFRQTRGKADIRGVTVGDSPIDTHGPAPDPAKAKYELVGGELLTGSTYVGVRGGGTFQHSGGHHVVEDFFQVGGERWSFPIPDWPGEIGHVVTVDPYFEPNSSDVSDSPRLSLASQRDSVTGTSAVTNVYIPPPVPSAGIYELSGGTLTAARQRVDYSGIFRQTGGENAAESLYIAPGGRYELSSGSLSIAKGLGFSGDFDFGGSNARLSAGSALVNLSQGRLQNAQNATITVGPDSLTIFPAGFDPATQLKSFSSAGLVHFAGSDLHVPAGQGFSGLGTIQDHAIVEGTIRVTPWNGPWPGPSISLLGGLELSGDGNVDLGSGHVYVGDDRSVIRGGVLRAERIDVVGVVVSRPTLVVWPDTVTNPALQSIQLPPLPGNFTVAPARLRQTAGKVVLTDMLQISDGRYELSGGELVADRVYYGGWSDVATAEFLQNGGVATIDHLLLSYPHLVARTALNGQSGASAGAPSAEFSLPRHKIERAPNVYRLNAGLLSAGSIEVGGMSHPASFMQAGGIVQVAHDLNIYQPDGIYTISGGKLTASAIEVGYAYGGTLAILDPAADITVTQRLTFDSASSFEAVPGAAIHFEGASFFNTQTNSSDLAGLGNLAMIFEGGDDVPDTFEVAGQDLGAVAAGFKDNFALGKLQVGGTDRGTVRLVDQADNQPAAAGKEALYVWNLEVGAASSLDLAGLDLYYFHASIDPGATITENGGHLLPVSFLPGDADLDGDADIFDVAIVQTAYGTTNGARWIDGDFDGNGTVDIFDVGILQTAFSGTASSPSATTVPEPASVVLALVAAGAVAGLLVQKRRRGYLRPMG